MSKSNGIWIFLSVVVASIIISGAAVYIATQNNQTQKDTAKIHAEAICIAGENDYNRYGNYIKDCENRY